ncbi:MAG: DUF6673 family protein [Peptostreptococcaceae bacterium]
MIINGIELELDIFDADVAEVYEEALEKVRIDAKVDTGAKMSVVIKTQCNAVFDFFDEVFGEGTSEDIFGGKTNLMTCLKAFEEVVDNVANQTKEAEQLSSKYSPNRAQRRTNKR